MLGGWSVVRQERSKEPGGSGARLLGTGFRCSIGVGRGTSRCRVASELG